MTPSDQERTGLYELESVTSNKYVSVSSFLEPTVCNIENEKRTAALWLIHSVLYLSRGHID